MKIGTTEIFPSKIICLGRNYEEHAKEMDSQIPKEPLFFCKTTNCLIKNGEPIIYPRILYESTEMNRVDHEVELAFIIKKKCKNIKSLSYEDYILGYTIFLDITAREMQKKDRGINLPWYRSKNFDTFGPLGPKLVEKINDPHNLKIELKVNGEIRQYSSTKHMIFKIPEIIEYLSKYITLEPGDIIATGTPSGVGPIHPGDILEATIEHIGNLSNNVILEDAKSKSL
jgi:2-keto-4-pentenoate hydratase/2-oxohepta-3-ene-1,7-dioic acid hydratase in catechol pathway